ncbi:MAG: VWA domain-containing protein [Magnetococcales bacterium]|nr:VWA domain-containing protein [Magnetococcales bacterium]
MIETFHWLRPGWLAALPLLIPLWWLLRRASARTRSDWQQVCDPHLLPRLLRSPTQNGSTHHAPALVTLTAALAISALAGPAWQKLPQPVYQKQSALVMILDLSRSMDATDLKPSRLERARLKIADLLKRRREGSTALIAFAGAAFPVTPLTTDAETIQAHLQALGSDIMPAQGSRPDLGIALAERMLAQAGHPRGEVLLITDGEPPPATLDAARHLRQQGHRLAVLAVGTPEGAPIPLPKGGLLQDGRGAIVVPRLNEAPLRELAKAGDGPFARLVADDTDLQQLLAERSSDRFDETTRKTTLTADLWHEEGPWLLVLILPLAALGFRRGVLVFWWLPFLLPPSPAHALDWEGAWQRPDQKAAAKWTANDPHSAAALFTDPAWKAAALYRAGRYAESLAALESLDTADSWYNQGNALARLNRLPESLKAYDEALKRDPQHADARHNRELVQKHLPKSPPADQPADPPESKSEDQKDQEKGQKPDQGKGRETDKEQEQQNASSSPDSSGQPDPKTSRSDAQPSADTPNPDKPDASAASGETDPSLSKDKEPSAPPKPGPPDDSKPDPPNAAPQQTTATEREAENRQAEEQWLRRIPDDPGGLLRRKFLYQYQRHGPTRPEANPW